MELLEYEWVRDEVSVREKTINVSRKKRVEDRTEVWETPLFIEWNDEGLYYSNAVIRLSEKNKREGCRENKYQKIEVLKPKLCVKLYRNLSISIAVQQKILRYAQELRTKN